MLKNICNLSLLFTMINLSGCAFVTALFGKTEEPKYQVYQVVSQQEQIEVREYDQMIVATTVVNSNREDATSDGFKVLADYIFGNNIVQEEIAMTAPVGQTKGAKISMTAPVGQTKSTKIPMTAPVGQTKSTTIAMTTPVQQQSVAENWVISFVMPSKYTMKDLPKPVNPAVTISAIPKKAFIVIKFSGRMTIENISKHEQILLSYINKYQLKVVGNAKYAFYNPPWTLPFWRRNEVMFELKELKPISLD